MKKRLVSVLLAALAIVGCQVKEEGELAPEGVVFSATMETMGDASLVDTKTSLDNEGNVLWTLGDQVSIFVGSTVNEHYQVTDASDGKTAAALFRVENPESVPSEAINNNVAFYPYEATAGIVQNESSYVISDIVFPYTQYFAQASFGNGAFPMVAVTSSASDYNLKFKNVLGGLKLRLKGTAEITSVSITGNNGEILCGSAEVTASAASAPSVVMTDADGTTATLICQEYVQLSETEATSFIIALPPMTMEGGFTVVISDSQGASMEMKTTRSQTITRSNILSMPAFTYVGTMPYVPPVPEAVNMGLPSGVKWATFNLGAGAPEEYGDYYAWGETEPYYTEGHAQDNPCSNWKDGKSEGYVWSTYKWCEGSESSLTKYFIDDDKMVLDSEDDAASANWGGDWRMPTQEDWAELIANCNWTWTTRNGVNGQLATSRLNNNSIFFPAAGDRQGTYFYYAGSTGGYWSSTVNAETTSNARYADFYSATIRFANAPRYYGFPVRPVSDEDVIRVTGVTLDPGNISLTEGETATLTATVAPSSASRPAVSWSSSDTDVASVDANGTVTAVAAGTATITVTTIDGGFTATCSVTVNAARTAVDLGLPSGRKWATFNLGATAPEEYGDYYAWGETEPDSDYSWASYRWCDNGNGSVLTRYNTKGYGTVDHRTDFICYGYEDDAARASWGDGWRMPTIDEWKELIDNCTSTWTTRNGVTGDLLTGPNGNSIFLPAAGYRRNSNSYRVGTTCDYWSSSLDKYTPTGAMGLNVSASDMSYDGYYHRYLGLAVRPVKDDSEWVPVTGISLPLGAVSLTVGQTYSMNATVSPSNATHKHIVWQSSNTSVASINWEGKVIAVSPGAATIFGTTCDGGYTAAYQAVVKEHEAVDLGLSSGIKWANCNVGAFAADEYGDYFAWGETDPYYMSGHSQDNPCSDWRSRTNPAITGYDWVSYKFNLGTDYYGPFSKYVTRGSYGTIDNNTVLDTEDDAAHSNWGGSWRMPTDADWTELQNECTWTWTALYGKNGYQVTGPNGKSIFLPAAGYRYATNRDSVGSLGAYWSSTLDTVDPYKAMGVGFDSVGPFSGSALRAYGYSVRPVKD